MGLKFLFFFLVFLLSFSSFSHRVLVNFIVGPQLKNGMDMQTWGGAGRDFHISTLNFSDADSIVGNNLGDFLAFINDKLQGIDEELAPFQFVGKDINRFPSESTGKMYYVFEATPETAELLKRIEYTLESYIVEYFSRKKELLPVEHAVAAAEAAHPHLRKKEIKGFPHLSLTVNTPPPADASSNLSQFPPLIVGYKIIYSFEFLDEHGQLKRTPQIFIEKLFEDPQFHISCPWGYLRNADGSKPLMSQGAHITPYPQSIRINFSDVLSKLQSSSVPLKQPGHAAGHRAQTLSAAVAAATAPARAGGFHAAIMRRSTTKAPLSTRDERKMRSEPRARGTGPAPQLPPGLTLLQPPYGTGLAPQ